MKIEGVPEGWELVRIGQPKDGEWVIIADGRPQVWRKDRGQWRENYPIVRKVERPKKYRPFANAEEFKPHRDKWCDIGGMCNSRPQVYTDERVYFKDAKFTWYQAFSEITFDDGTPFGVEVAGE